MTLQSVSATVPYDVIRACTKLIRSGQLDRSKRGKVYGGRGWAFVRTSQYKKAIPDLTKAIEIHPDAGAFYFYRGLSYGKLNDQIRAIADYTQAIAKQPGKVGAYVNRGTLYARRGDDNRAIADFKKALELKPGLRIAQQKLKQLSAHSGAEEQSLEDLPRPDELKAGDTLGAGISKRSTPSAPVHDCDRLAAFSGDPDRVAKGVALERIDPGPARRACERAVAEYPNVPRFRVQLGRAFQVAKAYKQAIEQYQTAAEQGNAIAMLGLAVLYEKGHGVQRDELEAMRWMQRSAQKGLPAAMFSLGLAYAQLNNSQRSADWISKALQTGDNSVFHMLEKIVVDAPVEFRRTLQQRMTQVGIYKGRTDGVFDLATLTSIKRFVEGARRAGPQELKPAASGESDQALEPELLDLKGLDKLE